MSVVSLELLLDPATDARIRSEWAALAAAGHSSLAAHTSASNSPHITLLVRSSIPELPAERLAGLVDLPLPLELGAPLLFGAGDRRVLARSVVPSAALLALHAGLHALADTAPVAAPDPAAPAAAAAAAQDAAAPAIAAIAGQDAPHTRPGEWTPHVTLARRLRLDSLPDALRILDALDALDHRATEPTGTAPTGTAPTGTAPARATVVGLRLWDAASATVTRLL